MASTLGGEAHFFEESMNATKVRSYLASNKESEKSRGMKFLLANMSKGRDMSEFFPDVVKNVVARAVEVKKMVYMYLVHYADATPACRELALLSINSFQKDLAAANQLIRALALRVMTSIRVPDIIQIQLLAVFKCAADSSPYVRRCAATAIPKLYAMDASQLSQLTEALERLLKDSSTMVLGAAVAAFNEVCPTHYALLHRGYRKLCHLLADMDEWTQIAVLTVLTRYVRAHFTDPAPGVTQAQAQAAALARSGGIGAGGAAAVAAGPVRIKRRVVRKAFYSDEEDVSEEEEVEVMPGGGGAFNPVPPHQVPNALFHRTADAELDSVELDPDHKLLLRSSLPLLKSRNCGVVLAVCALHHYCGTQTEATCAQLGKSLVRISRNRREIAFVVLQAIAAMARERPAMFRPFLPDFFVKATDPSFCRALKLDILTALVEAGNATAVLRELQSYVKHGDKAFVCAAVRAVGRVADAQPEVAPRCLHGLMGLLACVRSENVAGQAVVVIRQLLQQRRAAAAAGDDDAAAEGLGPVVKQLASVLISEKGQRVGAEARASLVWIVGEFIGAVRPAAPDVLRLLARGFADEPVPVKMQLVNLAVKLYLHHHKHRPQPPAAAAPSLLGGGGGEGESNGNGGAAEEKGEDDAVSKLVRYVLELARFDTNYDIRDRTRLLTASLGLAPDGGIGGGGGGVDAAALVALRAKAEEVFLPPKLPPLTQQGPAAAGGGGRGGLTVGSLSWMLHHKVPGYQELPDWAPLPSDPTIRDPPRAPAAPASASAGAEAGMAGGAVEGMFYSEDEGGSGSSSYESGDESSSGGGGSSSELGSYSDEQEEDSGSDSDASSFYSESGSGASPSPSSEGASGSDSGYSSSSSSSSSGSASGSSFDDSSDSDHGAGARGGNGRGGGGGGKGHRKAGSEGRRAGYDELGLGLSPPRPQKPSASAPSDDAGLLDLEAYASAKTKKGAGGGGGDLAAILQGLNTASLGDGGSGCGGLSASAASSSAGAAQLSAPRELLRAEAAGGLRVEAAFARDGGGGEGKGDVHAVVLRFAHTGQQGGAPLRHLRVAAAGAADHPRLVPPLPEVPVLEPGAVKDVRLVLDLKGEPTPSPLRLQLATDRGTYPLTLPIPPEELLRPTPTLGLDEAAAWQRALGGIHESRARVPRPADGDEDDDQGGLAALPDAVLRAARLALVSPRAQWAEAGRATFAARARAGGRVVVQVEVGAGGGGEVSLRVQADDAMLSASLLEVLRRAVAAGRAAS